MGCPAEGAAFPPKEKLVLAGFELTPTRPLDEQRQLTASRMPGLLHRLRSSHLAQRSHASASVHKRSHARGRSGIPVRAGKQVSSGPPSESR
jgi:hypothetical protein